MHHLFFFPLILTVLLPEDHPPIAMGTPPLKNHAKESDIFSPATCPLLYETDVQQTQVAACSYPSSISTDIQECSLSEPEARDGAVANGVLIDRDAHNDHNMSLCFFSPPPPPPPIASAGTQTALTLPTSLNLEELLGRNTNVCVRWLVRYSVQCLVFAVPGSVYHMYMGACKWWLEKITPANNNWASVETFSQAHCSITVMKTRTKTL